MSIQLLPNLPTQTQFDDAKASVPSFTWLQWFQSLVDLINRVVSNRVSVSTNATAIVCNGAVQSSGVGTAAITPIRYAETMVMARVTFNESAAGLTFVYVYRTTGNVPANGAAPGGGDVVVGGDAFAVANVNGQNFIGSLTFFDSGLSKTQAYKYYLAIDGPNAATVNLINASQLVVSEI